MAYAPRYARLINFLRKQLAGIAFAPGDVDLELNAIAATLDAQGTALRRITTASGTLRNVAQATAQAMAGRQRFVATAVQTLFTTLIAYEASSSVDVYDNGVLVDPNLVSFAANGLNNVAVTVTPGLTLGHIVVVEVYSAGAGILSRLASTAPGDGASLVAIQDDGALYIASDTEGALAEVRTALNNLIADLGTTAGLLRADGSVALAADLAAAGFTLTGLRDAVDDGEPITLRQLAGYIAVWADLEQFFLKRDGTTAMAGALNFGNQRGLNLADPDPADPFGAVNVGSIQRLLAQSGSLPVGAIIEYPADTPPTSWLICDGSVYKSDSFPLLSGLLPAVFKSGPAGGTRTARGTIDNTAGVVDVLTMTELGVGYANAPDTLVENTDGGAAPTLQPTFTITVTPVVVDGGNVTGGVLTVSILTGGTGVRDGAVLKFLSTSGGGSGVALSQMPNGYFRVPDHRGRVGIGAGTESKTPGVVDPPSVSAGDDYNASTRTVGQIGGEEQHILTTLEMPSHRHSVSLSTDDSAGSHFSDGSNTSGATGNLGFTGGDGPHNTVPPFVAVNFIIKAA